MLLAIGIDWDGRRQVLGVDLANRETTSSLKEFLFSLKQRGLKGVDDHAGLSKAIAEVLQEAFWQRCYVRFLRNVLDYLPRKADCNGTAYFVVATDIKRQKHAMTTACASCVGRMIDAT